MKSMMGPELASAFGVSEDALQNILNAQRESVILPAEQNYEKKSDSKTIPKIVTIMT